MKNRIRIERLEEILKPTLPPVVIIEEGEPTPEGAMVVIIDNIPKTNETGVIT